MMTGSLPSKIIFLPCCLTQAKSEQICWSANSSCPSDPSADNILNETLHTTGAKRPRITTTHQRLTSTPELETDTNDQIVRPPAAHTLAGSPLCLCAATPWLGLSCGDQARVPSPARCLPTAHSASALPALIGSGFKTTNTRFVSRSVPVHRHTLRLHCPSSPTLDTSQPSRDQAHRSATFSIHMTSTS